MSTKECSDIKKKLENNGYDKIDFVIKKDFASISIDYNYEEINVSSSEYNTKPELGFVSEKDKDWLLIYFDDDESSYKYYKDTIGNEYYSFTSDEDYNCYSVSGDEIGSYEGKT